MHTCLFACSLLFCYQLVRAVSVKKQDYKVDLPSVKMSNPNRPNLRLPGTIDLSPLLTPSHPNLGGQAGQGSGSPTLLGEYSPNSISPDSFSRESFQISEELRGRFHSSNPYHARDPSSHTRRPSSLGPYGNHTPLNPSAQRWQSSDGLEYGAPGIPPGTSPQLVLYLKRLEEENLRLRNVEEDNKHLKTANASIKCVFQLFHTLFS